MGQSELLLMLGAMVLFGSTLINTNQIMVEQNEDRFRREFTQYAFSLAKSYLDEAKAKPFFDETLNGGTPGIPNGFTGNGGLGPDGEVYPNFNDIDDFNGFSGVDSERPSFSVSIAVSYVDEPNWETGVNYKTRFKLMQVTVTENFYLNSSIQLSEVFAYIN